MVGKQHCQIDVKLAQLGSHRPGRCHDLRSVAATGERRPILGARGHPWEVEVPLVHLVDLSQRHVPRVGCVLGHLGGALVDVNVCVHDESGLERVARRRPRLLFGGDRLGPLPVHCSEQYYSGAMRPLTVCSG